MIAPCDLRLRNIRFHNDNFAVRIMRRRSTLSDARRLQKFIKQYISGVGIYEDKTQKSFIVQTYQEYNNVVDAIKVRDFLEKTLLEF